jgi:hypothetical protein
LFGRVDCGRWGGGISAGFTSRTTAERLLSFHWFNGPKFVPPLVGEPLEKQPATEQLVPSAREKNLRTPRQRGYTPLIDTNGADAKLRDQDAKK